MNYRHFVEDDSLKTMEHALLGLCAESGEVADVYKKSLYKGTTLDREKMLDELGDVRWYLELCCILLHTNLLELEQRNMDKLTKRRSSK
jgi:NTP pyrophosphatase (non-canonical NTP hydrolase)